MDEKKRVENEYLQQVMDQKEELERDLKAKRRVTSMVRLSGPGAALASEITSPGMDRAGGHETPAVEVRITGFWRWRTVVVPPNAYVVHTRRGYREPIDIGMGISFRFDPVRDSFLVVPATMQTIIIHANCICKERQGIVVQGYVQWIIEDFSIAYRKLDFSDPIDPMRVVNVQLREQAEAAIKDMVATMSIDSVLSDKQPIIVELTSRLRHVAEGDKKEEGLGLRIVTVQIKEAIVSSSRLWESLQKPFRAERAKDARLAELTHEAEVKRREAEEEQRSASLAIEKQAAINELRAQTEAQTFDREQNEKARRVRLEAELLEQAAQFEKAKLETESHLERLRLQQRLGLAQLEQEAQLRQATEQLELEAKRRKIENDLSSARLQEHLIDVLPSIVERLPKPAESKTITVGGSELQSVSGLLSGLVAQLARGPGKD